MIIQNSLGNQKVAIWVDDEDLYHKGWGAPPDPNPLGLAPYHATHAMRSKSGQIMLIKVSLMFAFDGKNT